MQPPRTRLLAPVVVLAVLAVLVVPLVPTPVFASALGSAPPSAAQGRIRASDLMELAGITAVDVAPDGSFAVYAVRTPHGDLGGKEGGTGYHTRLFHVALDVPGAQPSQLTHGVRSDSDPRISPDGRTLAFVRRGEEAPAAEEDDEDGPRAQVWLLPLDRPGEARQLTELEHGASAPRWRPDGGALLVASSIPRGELEGEPEWTDERPGRERGDADAPEEESAESEDPDAAAPDGSLLAVRRWLAQNGEEGGPHAITRIAFQGERGLRGEMRFRHLFLVPLEEGAEPARVTGGFRSFGDAEWSPEGDRVVAAAAPAGPRHPDRVLRDALHVLRLDGGEPAVLLDSEQHTFGSPRFTPDGELLYFSAQQRDEPTFRQRRLGRVRADGRGVPRIESGWEGHVLAPTVEPGGSLLFTSPWQGAVKLVRHASTGGFDDVYGGPGAVGSYGAGGGAVVAAVSSAEDPSALWLLEGPGAPRRLAAPNAPLLAERELSRPVEAWLAREDGTRVQYWVMPPVGLEPGRTAPVVLELHGGPHVMWGPGTFSMWHELQLLCARGYGVVYANPRGSNGYGYAHQRGNYRDWGVGPSGDVLAALEAALAEHEWMDPDRLFVTGGSYAGYLTAWIVGHDHRFQAAVAQRGVYDLATFFGEGNAWRLVEYAFGGPPWDPETRALLVEQSPFTHVAEVRTPLLIMHGSRDLRTGVSQSEMMYRALKELERPVEYVRYPGGDHDLSRTGDPRMRVDRLNRIVEFFERYRRRAE